MAKAEGKSVDGLKEAILGDAKSRLDEAVANEKLTQEQADRILERLREGIDNLVNASGENRMQFRFRGPGPGFGGGFGGPPGETPDNGAEPGDAAA